MRWWCLLCVAAAGCGRIAFDEREPQEVIIDFRNECVSGAGDVPSNYPVQLTAPAGRYRVSAEPSAGRFGETPDFRYWWVAVCIEIDLSAMASEDKATAEQAYDELPVKELDVDFPGGDLRCALRDSECTDNVGDVRFLFEQRL